ncbi:dihydroxyacetone kinase subunit DhaL [Anaerolentibacter hominis]|uniref:dihydroxyacetone kinase subunit DhaL n=1 Tax=Anaerolentibacter hominis TaxID=3079009 RepID=UPI0031B87F3F
MNIEQSQKFFRICDNKFKENMGLLSDLDAALGDGDHGASMCRGFELIRQKTDQTSYADIGAMWMDAAKILMKEIGGTCGPLFATILMKGAFLAKGAAEADTALMARMIRAGSDGVQALGKAAPGEKTMVDALVPAADAMEKASAEGKDLKEALSLTACAARRGAEGTKDMLASKGRGRYQAENALGHIDAGAVSVALIFEALYEAVT